MKMSHTPEEQRELLHILNMLSIQRAVGKRKVRVGAPHDGGYVMLDDFSGLTECYSLGIGPDVSWDMDMAQRGLEIFQYDHTVTAPPQSHPRFRHFKTGIWHTDDAPNMKRLSTLLKENHHHRRDSLVLKMDIEGCEWDVLDEMDPKDLLPFKQIVCEIHALQICSADSFRKRAVRAIANLTQYHQPIHIHGNNFTDMYYIHGIAVPDCIELTLARKYDYQFEDETSLFPTSLDFPCALDRPEMILGAFRYS